MNSNAGSPVLLGPVEKAERLFCIFDVDEDDKLSYRELCNFLSAVAEQDWADEQRYREWCRILAADPASGLGFEHFCKLLSLEERFVEQAYRGLGLESLGPKPMTSPAALRGELLKRALSGQLTVAASLMARHWRADFARTVATELMACCAYIGGELRATHLPPATSECDGPTGALALLLQASDVFVEAAARAANRWHFSFQDCLRRGSFDGHIKEWAAFNATWGSKIAAFQARCRTAEQHQQAVMEAGGAEAGAELVWRYAQAVIKLALATESACEEGLASPPSALQDLQVLVARYKNYGLPVAASRSNRSGAMSSASAHPPCPSPSPEAATLAAAAGGHGRPPQGSPPPRCASAMDSEPESTSSAGFWASQLAKPSSVVLLAVDQASSSPSLPPSQAWASSPSHPLAERSAVQLDVAVLSPTEEVPESPHRSVHREAGGGFSLPPMQQPVASVSNRFSLTMSEKGVMQSTGSTDTKRALADSSSNVFDASSLSLEQSATATMLPSDFVQFSDREPEDQPEADCQQAVAECDEANGASLAQNLQRPASRTSCHSKASNTSKGTYEMDDFDQLSDDVDEGRRHSQPRPDQSVEAVSGRTSREMESSPCRAITEELEHEVSLERVDAALLQIGSAAPCAAPLAAQAHEDEEETHQTSVQFTEAAPERSVQSIEQVCEHAPETCEQSIEPVCEDAPETSVQSIEPVCEDAPEPYTSSGNPSLNEALQAFAEQPLSAEDLKRNISGSSESREGEDWASAPSSVYELDIAGAFDVTGDALGQLEVAFNFVDRLEESWAHGVSDEEEEGEESAVGSSVYEIDVGYDVGLQSRSVSWCDLGVQSRSVSHKSLVTLREHESAGSMPSAEKGITSESVKDRAPDLFEGLESENSLAESGSVNLHQSIESLGPALDSHIESIQSNVSYVSRSPKRQQSGTIAEEPSLDAADIADEAQEEDDEGCRQS